MTPAFESGLAGLLPELRWRGMFHAASEGLEARLATERQITAYNGFDPSGPWLHIGHLVPIFGLIHLQRHGGRPIALVGGGTGMIGDPSGRSSERNLQSVERHRGERGIDARPARALPRLRRPERRADGEQPPTGSSRSGCSTSSATWASTSRSRTCSPRTRSRSGSRAGCRSPSSATCSSSRPTSSTSTASSAASSRWAARTSGATSPPAWS